MLGYESCSQAKGLHPGRDGSPPREEAIDRGCDHWRWVRSGAAADVCGAAPSEYSSRSCGAASSGVGCSTPSRMASRRDRAWVQLLCTCLSRAGLAGFACKGTVRRCICQCVAHPSPGTPSLALVEFRTHIFETFLLSGFCVTFSVSSYTRW